jgi:hypothetical protein
MNHLPVPRRAAALLLDAILAEQEPDGGFPTWRSAPADAAGMRLDDGAERLASPFLHTFVMEGLAPYAQRDAVRGALRRAGLYLVRCGQVHPTWGLEWRFFDPAFAPILPDADVLSRCLTALQTLEGLGLAPPLPASLFQRGLDRLAAHTVCLSDGHQAVWTWLGDREDNDVDPIVNANVLGAVRALSDPRLEAVEAYLRARLRQGWSAEYYDRPLTLPWIVAGIHARWGGFAAEAAILTSAAAGPPRDPLDDAMAAAIAAHLGGRAGLSWETASALATGPVWTFFKQRTPWRVYGSRAFQCAVGLLALRAGR